MREGPGMSALTKETSQSVRQLLVLAVIMFLGYFCSGRLRFTIGALNLIFFYAWMLVPFLAIKPALRLHRRPRIVGLIILIPLLCLWSLLLLAAFVLGADGRAEITRPLQAFQVGNSTIELGDYDYGGAVGVHGLNLEQRRLIFPGLYLVKSVDFFENASEATLSVDGPDRVRIHPGNDLNKDFRYDKVYSLKPWVYF